MRTTIIAEAGSCHDGELQKALALADTAKTAGADVIKYQFWSSADRMAQRRHAPEYRDVYAKGQIPREWLATLKAHADTLDLEFMCSTYLPEDIEVVAPFVQRFKIASFERGDWPFVAAHARFSKPLIISLGMEELGKTYMIPPWDTTYLHCVSSYPAPIDQLNLQRIRQANGSGFLGRRMGFSDHAAPDHTWTGALAVAAGATMIERHLRLYETLDDNPDFGHAMAPRAFSEYCRHIRFAESCLGDGRPGMQPCEAEMAKYRVTA